MDDNYQELSLRASKGDEEALAELFSAGEKFEFNGQFKEASTAFKDSAVAYRIAAFRSKAQAEDAIAGKRYQIQLSQVLTDWIKNNPEGMRNLPRKVPGLTEPVICELVARNREELSALLVILYNKRSKLGKGFSWARTENYVCGHLGAYFDGRIIPDSAYMRNPTIRVLLDSIANVVEAKFHAESKTE